ncbi:unnamed protein product, partial [marine sediment metagenome]
MATCKNCDKSGFFVFVNSSGLCNECSPIITSIINNNFRIISESIELIKKSKNFKTRLSRCDLILNIAEKLLEYENKGIQSIKP